MLDRLYKTQECSAARALEVVGERWSLLILRDAMFRGYTRFSDFQRSLGIATNILAKRLDGFVQDGLMSDEVPAGAAGNRQYHLTGKGRALMPVIIALAEWGDEWVAPGPVTFAHAACGNDVRVNLRCDHCGDGVPADAISAAKTSRI